MKATLKSLSAARSDAAAALAAKRAELLRDPEYVRLREAFLAADKAYSRAVVKVMGALCPKEGQS